jgi:hypothetical protein
MMIETLQRVGESHPAYVFNENTAIDFRLDRVEIRSVSKGYKAPGAVWEDGMVTDGPYVEIGVLNCPVLHGLCMAKNYPVRVSMSGGRLGYVNEQSGYAAADLGMMQRSITALELEVNSNNMVFSFELSLDTSKMLPESCNYPTLKEHMQPLNLRYAFRIPLDCAAAMLRMDEAEKAAFAKHHRFSYGQGDGEFRLTN